MAGLAQPARPLDSNWTPVNSNAQQAAHNAQDARSTQQAGTGGRLGSTQSQSKSIEPQTLIGLNRSAAARQRGQFQTRQFQNFRRGGGRFRR